MLIAFFLLVFFTSGSSWHNSICHHKNFFSKLKSINEISGPLLSQKDTQNPYHTQLDTLIDQLVEYDVAGNLQSGLDDNILTDHSDLLCKENVYDTVIMKKFESVQNDKTLESLRKIDSLLRGFISSETSVRSRLKVSYLVAGTCSNKLEYCVKMLLDNDEIDQALFQYISKLVKVEQSKLAELEVTKHQDDDYDIHVKGKAQLIDALEIILRRLKAELKIKYNQELKLLVKLINCRDIYEREKILNSITSIEFIQSFKEYLNDGIKHLIDKGNTGKEDTNSSETVELKPETIEKMKDILRDVEIICRKFSSNL